MHVFEISMESYLIIDIGWIYIPSLSPRPERWGVIVARFLLKFRTASDAQGDFITLVESWEQLTVNMAQRDDGMVRRLDA